jgi:thioredoxin-related protein
MKYNLYILLLFTIFSEPAWSQQASRVNWMTWEQAVSKTKNDPRKIMVHIYTEGCNPCKYMDNTTFASQEVVDLINKKFYSVKLDAKSKDALKYDGKSLQYKCSSGSCFHELAWELTGGSLSFPSVIFLDEGQANIGTIPDYKDANQFLLYVEYYGFGFSSKMPFSKYPSYRKKHGFTHKN